jgi:hypothetical protein
MNLIRGAVNGLKLLGALPPLTVNKPSWRLLARSPRDHVQTTGPSQSQCETPRLSPDQGDQR